MVGFISSSNLILFNGVKNLLAAIFTFPSVIALKFIRKEDIEKYPFGKEGMEPIVAIVQYCALIYICISNVVTAVHFLLSGGCGYRHRNNVCFCFYCLKKSCLCLSEETDSGWLNNNSRSGGCRLAI